MPRRAARILSALALDRPAARAWALYDWANSAVWTTVISAFFPLYFGQVAAADLERERSTRYLSLATTIALLIVAVLAPFLGALADVRAWKRRFLFGFAALGMAATAGLFLVGRGDWPLALGLFVLVNVGVAGSVTFYDALLPHVARPDEVDRLSASGFALGYVGGGLVLALNLAWIQRPHWFGLDGDDATLPVRLSFLSVAVWWAVFSLPLWQRVPEPPLVLEADESLAMAPLRTALVRLGETFRALRRHRDAFCLLSAFLLYNDGILTIIRLATAFGNEHGFPTSLLVQTLLLVQFVGIPCSIVFGKLAQRIPAKRLILFSLAVYALVTVLAYRLKTQAEFVALGLLVALVQGGSQALSRSLFASLVPRHKSAEFFALFGVGEKFAGIFGPLLFFVLSTITGSSALAILSILFFFVAGAILLAFVDVERGRASARAAEAGLRPAECGKPA
jgi:UMF1 family MFS transporter